MDTLNKLSETPTYDVLMEGIRHYRGLFHDGLKKKANRFLTELADDLRRLPENVRDQLLFQLCADICDGGDSCSLKERGNGRIPYALDQVVWEYLKRQCELDRMPQLRWTFELYNYNPFDRTFNPNDVLRRAFYHHERDEKTTAVYFGSLLSFLGWGAHHFPEGCIIERSSYEDTVRECHAVMEQVRVNENQLQALRCYESLYRCYYQYKENVETLDFYELCEASGISFESIPAYYCQR